MKKTWIKIKRGLLTPEHREILGVRVWLYMYMLDRADWDSGIIYGWKDKEEAEDFGMPWRRLQQQRQQLEADGYISCEQKQYYQNITIHNWVNPREYTGELYNPISGGTEKDVPIHGDTEKPVPSQGTYKGTYDDTYEVHKELCTPTFNPQITNHSSDEGAISYILKECESLWGTIAPSSIDKVKEWLDYYPKEWIVDALEEAKKHDAKSLNYVTAILERWFKQGRGDNKPIELNSIEDELARRGYVHHKAA